MKFRTYIIKNMKTISLVLLTLCVFFSSCSKDGNDTPGNGLATLKISLQSVNYDEQSIDLASAKEASMTALEAEQPTSISFNSEYKIVARLTPEAPLTLQRATFVASAAKGMTAATQVDNVLANGTKYRVVVYNSAGAYVANVVYSVGSETTEGFALDADKTYTFIAFSTGSTTTVPNVSTSQTLSTATLAVSGNENFMWYSKTIKLTSGVNNLNVILKHRFSQITTVINASAIPDINNTNGIANITAVSASINPHRATTSIKLSDGSITYTGTATSKTVSFPTLGTSTVTSAPTIVSANTTTGTYTISSMTIGGKTKTGFTIPNLKITPGVRYKLVLTLEEKSVDYGGSHWSLGNLIYNASTQKYGFAATTDAYGNYFFPNYVLPKRLDINNQNPSLPAGTNPNGATGDPCLLVIPLNTWRLPTGAEFQEVFDLTAPRGAETNYEPTRYVGPYNGSGTNYGMFFDIQVSPGERYPEFLFFSYGGAYHNVPLGGAVQEIGSSGAGLYMVKSGNTYGMLRLADRWTAQVTIDAVNASSAIQIRCVKNAP